MLRRVIVIQAERCKHSCDDNSPTQNEPLALYFHFPPWKLRTVCFIRTAVPQWDRAKRLFARGSIRKKLPLLQKTAPPQSPLQLTFASATTTSCQQGKTRQRKKAHLT